ncbi:hypothetical protein FBU30_001163 [Linnemannia zychae]|nr:hypothetical protein FBU30_001163 [Linnemannia zychae]
MGLKEVKFIDWFQGKFPQAVRTINKRDGAHFDSVFIDVNCLLHPAMRAAKNESAFVKKLFIILDKTLNQFIPNRICYLSVDGPAPLAKLLTQKGRRASKAGKEKPNHMSRLQVTPGCPFMLRLEKYLNYYTVRYLQHRRSQGISPDLKFVIDHSNNPGEGESKIIENIVLQADNIRGRPCAILSMDSDAIIQAICLGMPNIYVVRNDSPQNPTVVVSIDKFMQLLEEMFPGNSNRTRLDFCALCLFRGNDYLRGLFVGLERLWLAYLYTRYVDPTMQTRGNTNYLIDADAKTFDLFFLKQLTLNSYKSNDTLKIPDITKHHEAQQQQSKQQASSEPDTEVSEQDESENTSDVETENEVQDSSDDETEGNIDASGSDSEVQEDISQGNRSLIVKDYLEGVLWNLEMYCAGVCPDVSFSYKYQAAPPRRAIVEFIDAIAQKKLHQALSTNTTKKLISVVRANKSYPHPLVCAMILLPTSAAEEYLPKPIALVQPSIVPTESKTLTYDEVMTVLETIHGIIEVLAKSSKLQDKKLAKELYELYNFRSPYIWTRVRAVRPRTPKITMPLSPSVIIDALQELSISSEENNAAQQQKRFVDLEYQQDIICTLTKTPSSAVQIGQSNSTPAAEIKWAVDHRQTEITTRHSTSWIVFSYHHRYNRTRSGQQQRHGRPQNQQTQQNQQQLPHQAKWNNSTPQRPQISRPTPQSSPSTNTTGLKA